MSPFGSVLDDRVDELEVTAGPRSSGGRSIDGSGDGSAGPDRVRRTLMARGHAVRLWLGRALS